MRLLIAWMACTGLGVAEDRPSADVSIGFGGVFQVGRWTPIVVRPAAGQEVRTGTATAVDVDGRPVAFPLRSQPDGTLTGLIQSGRLDAPIRVKLTTPDGNTTTTQSAVGRESGLTCLRQETRLWMLAGEHTGFVLAADQLNSESADGIRAPRVRVLSMDASGLPASADALQSLHMLVLGADPIPSAQSEAIRAWVERGGRLVIVLGRNADEYAQNPVSKWVPVRAGGAIEERQTAALTGRITAFVPNKGILRSLDALRVVPLTLPSGLVLIDGPSSPVAVRAAYGLGTVTVVGLDLEAPPFVTRRPGSGSEPPLYWGGLPQMCAQLAGETVQASGGATAERQLQLSPTGISDLASQLMAIMDDFPQIERASNWNVIGLLAVYLLLIGPVDYLVVHRLLRRPQWTWVTLPAWVLLASWWATAMANETNGQVVLTKQIDILDVSVDTGTQRLSSWFSLYSPETRRHDVAFRPLLAAGSVPGDSRLALLARPEEGFRGLYRRGGINLGGAGYELASSPDQAEARQSPVDQWSSLVLAADAARGSAPNAAAVAELRQIVGTDGTTRRLEFMHHLPGELSDWFVVQRLEVTFPMPTGGAPQVLLPGKKVDLTRGCGQKLLKAFIQGELTTTVPRKTGTDTYIRAGVYDPLGLDPLPLMRALSFHEAIDGSDYTRLTNQTLDRLDLSASLHLDRAIIFGRLTRPVAAYTVDGQPVDPAEQSTFVRMLVPVMRDTVSAVAESP